MRFKYIATTTNKNNSEKRESMQNEEVIISAASRTSVTGAGAAVVGTVSQVDIMALTGASTASICRGWNHTE